MKQFWRHQHMRTHKRKQKHKIAGPAAPPTWWCHCCGWPWCRQRRSCVPGWPRCCWRPDCAWPGTTALWSVLPWGWCPRRRRGESWQSFPDLQGCCRPSRAPDWSRRGSWSETSREHGHSERITRRKIREKKWPQVWGDHNLKDTFTWWEGNHNPRKKPGENHNLKNKADRCRVRSLRGGRGWSKSHKSPSVLCVLDGWTLPKVYESSNRQGRRSCCWRECNGTTRSSLYMPGDTLHKPGLKTCNHKHKQTISV